MSRLAKMVRRTLDMLDDIRVTLDSHQLVHIAHPICWVNAKGERPGYFTIITVSDVEGPNPVWKAFNPKAHDRQVQYVKDLAAAGKNPLVIWPPHCLIGTPGHAVMPELHDALTEWSNQYALIDYVTKGSYPWAEHYSVVKADVVCPEAPETDINTRFVQRLQEADEIFIAGEALSHCVLNSVKDIATEFGDEHVKKLVLLEDASSPVGDQPGSTMFSDMARDFIKEMQAKGMQVARTTDF